MKPPPEKLFAVAKHLNLRWHANACDADDCIVPFADPNATYFEHLCHELAHAVLLGLPLGPYLADRVEEARPDELNETQAFAVTMGVFDYFGVPYDVADIFEANRMQVIHLEDAISDTWSDFRCTTTYETAVETLVDLFLKETSSTPTASSTPSTSPLEPAAEASGGRSA